MPERSKQSRPKKPSQKPASVPETVALGESRSLISQYMAEIGRRGGKVGGKRRLQTMSAEDRRKVASAAAKARWKKSHKKPR